MTPLEPLSLPSIWSTRPGCRRPFPLWSTLLTMTPVQEQLGWHLCFHLGRDHSATRDLRLHRQAWMESQFKKKKHHLGHFSWPSDLDVFKGPVCFTKKHTLIRVSYLPWDAQPVTSTWTHFSDILIPTTNHKKVGDACDGRSTPGTRGWCSKGSLWFFQAWHRLRKTQRHNELKICLNFSINQGNTSVFLETNMKWNLRTSEPINPPMRQWGLNYTISWRTKTDYPRRLLDFCTG